MSVYCPVCKETASTEKQYQKKYYIYRCDECDCEFRWSKQANNFVLLGDTPRPDLVTMLESEDIDEDRYNYYKGGEFGDT